MGKVNTPLSEENGLSLSTTTMYSLRQVLSNGMAGTESLKGWRKNMVGFYPKALLENVNELPLLSPTEGKFKF